MNDLLSATGAEAMRITREGLSALVDKDALTAEACGHIATTVDPQSAAAWFLLGCASARLAKLDRARSAYEQAAALDPTHARTQIDLAEVCLKLLDYPRAADCLAKALAIDPKNARARALIVKTAIALENT